MKTSKRVFFGYARESIDLESGITIQKQEIEKYAKAYGIPIKKIYIDNNRSAFKDRPEFEKMWNRLDDVGGIIVNRLDRFGRNFGDLLWRFSELKDLGKVLICIAEGINTANPESEFFLKILGIFAERERTVIRERMVAGLKLAREQGSKSGKPCNRPKIAIDMDQVHAYIAKGLSVRDCGRLMGFREGTLYRRIKDEKTMGKNVTVTK